MSAPNCLPCPKAVLWVCDRGYNGYSWYKLLTEQRVFHVTRQRGTATYEVIERRAVPVHSSVISDAVELFFKWIKQNLKIKSFLGTSKNAVMIQIWTSMCVHLLLAVIKFSHQVAISQQQILRLLALNLFAKWDLIRLIKTEHPPHGHHSIQGTLW